MNKTLKLILTTCAAVLASQALAWNTIGHEAIAIIAEQNLSSKAKSEAEAILGCCLKSAAVEAAKSEDFALTRVGEDMHSTTTCEKDAVVRLEKAVKILESRTLQSAEALSAALRTIIHLTAELHCPGHIAIEGKEDNFAFKYNNGRFPDSRFYRTTDSSWQKFWDVEYFRRHEGYSADMYAYDSSIFARNRKEQLRGGTPREWVEQIASESAPIRQHFAQTEVVERVYVNGIEEQFDTNVARSGLRLAALLDTLLGK